MQEAIHEASGTRRLLRIQGGGSKDFLGGALRGDTLDTSALVGIIDYEPTELVITAGAGTSLTQLEDTLNERNQMLAFEPPLFEGRATLGGTVAAGLSGPRRAYSGPLRDFVLGVRMLDGRGDDLRFGGSVIKNVAGFDVSRLMAGSFGTLGVLTEVSLKTLPRPALESTIRFEMDQSQALSCMNQWATRPLPLSATAWHDGQLHVRLSGADASVRSARRTLGGEVVSNAESFWNDLREHRLELLRTSAELWRVSLPSTAPELDIPGPTLVEWGGALRWLPGPQDEAAIRESVIRLGGHVTSYRNPRQTTQGAFQPLSTGLTALHRRLKAVFDPHGIFNRGRLYPDF